MYNILLVDDEASNLNALERTLRGEYNVFPAASGEDALAIMEQNNIDLIIADYRMPGMDGLEFLQKVLQRYPNTIRIILTAYTSEKLLMDAINVVRVHGCIAKPWDPEEVKALVRNWEKLEAERKRTEEELKGAQKYARDIIESSMDMIIAVDKDRKIIEFNTAAQKTFGYSPEEILGQHVGILYNDPKAGAGVNESLKKTGVFVGEIINKRKNGELFPSFISASILYDARGEFIGFMGISRDITERKRMEEKLREAEKMAYLGRLVAGATHELNNPISFVYSNLPHLRQYIQDIKMVLARYQEMRALPASRIAGSISDIEELKEELDFDYVMEDLDRLLDDIEEGSIRTKRIVEALKIFPRSYEGRVEDTDINEDIEASLRLLMHHYKDRITIHKDYSDLPRVKCYEGQIAQVIVNMITNACEAIKGKGDIWLKTSLEDHTVVISIRDSGVGIAEEDIHNIFDPFFTTKDTSTGLGLSISYGIIQRHRGEISVDSKVGSGSTFTIRIPVDFES